MDSAVQFLDVRLDEDALVANVLYWAGEYRYAERGQPTRDAWAKFRDAVRALKAGPLSHDAVLAMEAG